MEKFYIRFHIKGGNRVVTRMVENYTIDDVMSELLYDLKNQKRILFKKNPDTVCGVFVESISFFEIQTEKEHQRINDLSVLGGAFK